MDIYNKLFALKKDIMKNKNELKEACATLSALLNSNENCQERVNELTQEIFILVEYIDVQTKELQDLKNSQEYIEFQKLRKKYYQQNYYEKVRSRGLKVKKN